MALESRHHLVILELSETEGVAVVDDKGRLRAWDDLSRDALGDVPGLSRMGLFPQVPADQAPFNVHDIVALEDRLHAVDRERIVLFEHALTANFTADADGSLRSCNAAFLKVFGFASGAHAADSSYWTLFPDQHGVAEVQRMLERDGLIERQTVQLIDRERRPVYAVQSLIAERDDDGTVVRIHGAIYDRTEEQRLEEQLLHSQRIDAVGRLAGGVAHDFNNLLTVILSYAQLLEQSIPRSGEQLRHLAEIRRAGERASELTNRLLSYGRRQVVHAQDVDLNDLLKSIRDLLRSVLPADIELDIIPGHDLAKVHADGSLIEQVLMNLTINARDAMVNGGRLTIETENVSLNGAYMRTHPWAKSGRYVLLTVSDTGCGMTREVLEHAFEPFFTTKMPGKGTGLGLASSYGIVKQHDGLIHAYSEVGVGTTFKVYLPASTRAASLVGTKIAPRVEGGMETVLVAEDEEAVRDVCTLLLQAKGYRVLTACDGEDAVRLFLKGSDGIKLVLLDVVMPIMGGVAAYEQIRRISPTVPILFTSGYSGEALASRLSADDRTGFIPKPYDPDRLLAKIREAIDASGGAVEEAAG